MSAPVKVVIKAVVRIHMSCVADIAVEELLPRHMAQRRKSIPESPIGSMGHEVIDLRETCQGQTGFYRNTHHRRVPLTKVSHILRVRVLSIGRKNGG